MSRSRDTYAHQGAFVLRAPLLPFATLDALGDDLAGGLRALLADPVVREAVFLASPTLDERIERWLAGDEPDEAEVLRPVLSYVTRMAGRPTPFGLFAGCAVGAVGGETNLVLPERERATRHTRLDFGFLAKVVALLTADPDVQPYLTLVPNTSLYRAGARLRMAEARVDEQRGVRYHRVTFEEDDALTETLDRARDGARLDDLAAALADDEVTHEEAVEYVRELVAAQLLVSDLGPVVTGDAAVPRVVAALEQHAPTKAHAAALDAADRELDAIDAGGVGSASRERYVAVADALRAIEPDLRLDRLFQVDLARPAPGLRLGDDVVAEIHRAVDVLHPLAHRPVEDELTRFRDAFVQRYEQREVPLAEALDEEIGIGYGPAQSLAAEGAPLLAGLVPGVRAAPGPAWTNADAHLLRVLTRALTTGATAVELAADDLTALADADPPPLPDALSATVIVVPDGDSFRVVVEGIGGPSGARLLGRFCHLDGGIEDLVRRHVEAEERLLPDAVFTEVVHLPEGRVGNILARPVLREYETPFLAVSGLPAERRLPLDDLMVSVAAGRIVLRSNRLGREVIPRITNAHNHQTGALAVYRFLGALQYQGVASGLAWSWGALRYAPFLPRVTYGRLVLSLARWLLLADDVTTLREARTDDAREAAVADLRERVGLPRRVVVSVGDNDLPVDLDTAGGRALLAHEARRGSAQLVEMYPGPGELAVSSPEGTFVHEIVLPLVRVAPQPPVARVEPESEDGVESVFPPGSEWLTAKLYTGRATADAVLREVVAPLVAETRDVADGWFFLRYTDPEHHVRVRFHGDTASVLARLNERVRPLLDDGRVWRVQLDTYRREVARYGGPEGVVAAERVFRADSDAVLAILAAAEGDAGLDARWRLAVCGVDRLLADAGLDVERRRAAVRRWRDAFVAEHGPTGDNAKQHAGRLFRRERAALEPLLAGTPTDALTRAGLAALAQRSATTAPLLAGTPENVLGSHTHMHVNRMLRGAQRAQELVVYDLLDRLYAARLGRERAAR